MNFRREMRSALREDHAWGDVTSRAFIPAEARAAARLVAREAGVAAGVRAAAEVFKIRDLKARVRIMAAEGRAVKKGQVLLEARGSLSSLLSAERVALNTLSHLSGIATLTRAFVKKAGPRVKILDTRKTLPGLRAMEKWAVRCGGGANHRMHLQDAVLIKDNHLAFVRNEKDLARFFRRVKGLQRRGLPVEMECKDRREVLWGLLAGADILLLDNFSSAQMPRVCRWIKDFCREKGLRRPLLEISGGVDLKTVGAAAKSGADRISIGRLTHSAPALDVSMDVFLVDRPGTPFKNQ